MTIKGPSAPVLWLPCWLSPPAMQEMQVQSLHWEDPLEEEMATLSNILAWEIPGTEGPGRLQFIGLQRLRYDSETKQQQQQKYKSAVHLRIFIT